MFLKLLRQILPQSSESSRSKIEFFLRGYSDSGRRRKANPLIQRLFGLKSVRPWSRVISDIFLDWNLPYHPFCKNFIYSIQQSQPLFFISSTISIKGLHCDTVIHHFQEKRAISRPLLLNILVYAWSVDRTMAFDQRDAIPKCMLLANRVNWNGFPLNYLRFQVMWTFSQIFLKFSGCFPIKKNFVQFHSILHKTSTKGGFAFFHHYFSLPNLCCIRSLSELTTR